jgi:hypothetical protein
MYCFILLAILFLEKPLHSKCVIDDIKTKLQAFLMPFDQSVHHKLNYFDGNTILTNHYQNHNRSNIKAKKLYITVWLKRNIPVK